MVGDLYAWMGHSGGRSKSKEMTQYTVEVSVSTGERVNSPAQFFILIFKNNNDILKDCHGNNSQATRNQKPLELLLPGHAIHVTARVAEIKQIRLEEVLKKVILFGEGRPSVLKI